MSTFRDASYGADERRLAMVQADGVPLSRDRIVQEVMDPHWETVRPVRDWRRYVPGTLRADWARLPLEARLCAFEVAELVALEEDVGAPMLSGVAGAPAFGTGSQA